MKRLTNEQLDDYAYISYLKAIYNNTKNAITQKEKQNVLDKRLMSQIEPILEELETKFKNDLGLKGKKELVDYRIDPIEGGVVFTEDIRATQVLDDKVAK